MGNLPIYALYRVFQDIGGQFSLCKWPPQPHDFLLRIRLSTCEDVKTISLGHPNWFHRPGILSWCPGYSYNLLLFITVDIYTAKLDPKWVILIIWYGTLMLEYLLVEWTDFRSVYWFELSLSRAWIPVSGVLFLSAVFEKLARTNTAILTF